MGPLSSAVVCCNRGAGAGGGGTYAACGGAGAIGAGALVGVAAGADPGFGLRTDAVGGRGGNADILACGSRPLASDGFAGGGLAISRAICS